MPAHGLPRLTAPVRALVLTAGFGEGHNAAARAVTAAFNAAGGPGRARLVDIFARATPRVDAVTRRLYLGCINRTPKLWSRLYRWIDRADLFPRHLWTLRAAIRELRAVLAEERPDVICSSYPIYAFMLNELERRGEAQPPHFNIVTDSISINSLWHRAPCAGWFVPNADSAEVLGAAGLAPARIHDCGFPVAPFFSEQEHRLAPPDLADGERPRVLYIINSGTRRAEATAAALLAQPDWEVTCAVGRDARLFRRLETLAENRAAPARIFGWTDQIPALLMTHHVVISKAGGATTQEAIAARCPMIVNQIVPGQEEGNYELLRRHGIGGLAETPAAAVATLRQAFAESGAGWRRWRAALEPLARPDAARRIAAMAAAHAQDISDAKLHA